MIRRLAPGDEDVVAALEEAYERPIPRSLESELLHDSRAHLLVAELDDAAVGYVLVYVLPRIDARRMAFLYDIGVAEPHRRRGIGRALVEEAARTARDEGAHKLFVLTDEENDAAMALYARAGGRRQDDQVMFEWAFSA
jgi:ribosomal protein S18 acetylase RimI-like enzyme